MFRTYCVKQLHIDTQENKKINGTSYGNMHQTNVMEKKYILCLCFWIGCLLPKCPRISTCGQATEYLVELRGHTALSLTNQEANTIIALWQNLDDRDKKRVVYAAWHQKRLLSGCFRVLKMPTQTPGVESTTRSVLGTSSAPAQWPDCCRLVENIFIRLCTVHPSPKRKGKGTLSR